MAGCVDVALWMMEGACAFGRLIVEVRVNGLVLFAAAGCENIARD